MIEQTALEWATTVANTIDIFGWIFVTVFALLIVLTSPLANILNIVTMPFGYQIQSCPHCPAVGIERRQFTTCAWCGDRFAYYGYTAGVSRPISDDFGLRVPFCSNEHLTEWKEAGEEITPEIAWASDTYRITAN